MSKRRLPPTVEPQSEVRTLQLTSIEYSDVLRKAHLVLKYSHETAKGFLDAFDLVRERRMEERGITARGTTTDEEQDLLRGMLVMAAAGLDSMLKQTIRDALEALIQADESVRDGLETFVSRQIRGSPDQDDGFTGHRFLARVLMADSHRDQVVEEYIRHLSGTSLQSVQELRRTARALGLESDVIGAPDRTLIQIFRIRNRIIHEFDINFDLLRRNRQTRSRDVMVAFTNTLLEVAESILQAVDRKLSSSMSYG